MAWERRRKKSGRTSRKGKVGKQEILRCKVGKGMTLWRFWIKYTILRIIRQKIWNSKFQIFWNFKLQLNFWHMIYEIKILPTQTRNNCSQLQLNFFLINYERESNTLNTSSPEEIINVDLQCVHLYCISYLRSRCCCSISSSSCCCWYCCCNFCSSCCCYLFMLLKI